MPTMKCFKSPFEPPSDKSNSSEHSTEKNEKSLTKSKQFDANDEDNVDKTPDKKDRSENKQKTPSSRKNTKKEQNLLVRSLTDEEYNDIFNAVLERVPSLESDDEEEDVIEVHEIEHITSERNDEKPEQVSDEDDFESIMKDLHEENADKNEKESANKTKKELESIEQKKKDSASVPKPKVISSGNTIHNKSCTILSRSAESKSESHKGNVKAYKKAPFTQRTWKLDNKKSEEILRKKDKSRSFAEKYSSKEKKEKRSFVPSYSKKERKAVDKQKHKGKKEKHAHRRSKRDVMKERKVEVAGTWVQCEKSDCGKWRYLADITDPAMVAEHWVCEMNTDKNYNDCDVAEQSWDEEEHTDDFVINKFTEGSIVWARMNGFPWWPGMVETDPDNDTFFECNAGCGYGHGKSNVATHYHVVFLDNKVTRAWIHASNLATFTGMEDMGSCRARGINYKKQIEAAVDLALSCLELSIPERIKKYGFVARFKGRWGYESDSEEDDEEEFMDLEKSHRSLKRKHSGGRKHKSKKMKHKHDRPRITRQADVSDSEVSDLLEGAEDIIRSAEDALEEFFSGSSQQLPSSEDENYMPDTPLKKKNGLKKKRKDHSTDEKVSPVKRKKHSETKNNKNVEKEKKTDTDPGKKTKAYKSSSLCTKAGVTKEKKDKHGSSDLSKLSKEKPVFGKPKNFSTPKNKDGSTLETPCISPEVRKEVIKEANRTPKKAVSPTSVVHKIPKSPVFDEVSEKEKKTALDPEIYTQELGESQPENNQTEQKGNMKESLHQSKMIEEQPKEMKTSGKNPRKEKKGFVAPIVHKDPDLESKTKKEKESKKQSSKQVKKCAQKGDKDNVDITFNKDRPSSELAEKEVFPLKKTSTNTNDSDLDLDLDVDDKEVDTVSQASLSPKKANDCNNNDIDFDMDGVTEIPQVQEKPNEGDGKDSDIDLDLDLEKQSEKLNADLDMKLELDSAKDLGIDSALPGKGVGAGDGPDNDSDFDF